MLQTIPYQQLREQLNALRELVRCNIDIKQYATTVQTLSDELNAIEGLDVEYYHIVNGITLQEVTSWDEAEEVVGCITVFCGARPVRLIDNIRYK